MKRIDMMTSTQKCFLKETIGEAALKHGKTNFVCECDIGRISCLECYFRYDDCSNEGRTAEEWVKWAEEDI